MTLEYLESYKKIEKAVIEWEFISSSDIKVSLGLEYLKGRDMVEDTLRKYMSDYLDINHKLFKETIKDDMIDDMKELKSKAANEVEVLKLKIDRMDPEKLRTPGR